MTYSVSELEEMLEHALAEQEQAEYLARRCAVCGEADEENGGSQGYLTQFELVIARGEQDHSAVERWLCEHHLLIVSKVLVQVGVGSHYHETFNHIELDQCAGHHWYEDCPEPEDKDGRRV